MVHQIDVKSTSIRLNFIDAILPCSQISKSEIFRAYFDIMIFVFVDSSSNTMYNVSFKIFNIFACFINIDSLSIRHQFDTRECTVECADAERRAAVFFRLLSSVLIETWLCRYMFLCKLHFVRGNPPFFVS